MTDRSDVERFVQGDDPVFYEFPEVLLIFFWDKRLSDARFFRSNQLLSQSADFRDVSGELYFAGDGDVVSDLSLLEEGQESQGDGGSGGRSILGGSPGRHVDVDAEGFSSLKLRPFPRGEESPRDSQGAFHGFLHHFSLVSREKELERRLRLHLLDLDGRDSSESHGRRVQAIDEPHSRFLGDILVGHGPLPPKDLLDERHVE